MRNVGRLRDSGSGEGEKVGREETAKIINLVHMITADETGTETIFTYDTVDNDGAFLGSSPVRYGFFLSLST